MSSIAVHDTTGKRLHCVGCVHIHDGSAWRSLKEQIAAQYGIPEVEIEEAIRIEEDEDGIEWCAVDGRTIGYVVTESGGHREGEPEWLTADALDPVPTMEAAE